MTVQATDKTIFRKTNARVGHNVYVTPSNSTNKHLAYGRIILDKDHPSASFCNGGCETGLICLSGVAKVSVGPEGFQLHQYDSLYIPRDSEVEVSTDSSVDIAEFYADVDQRYPLKFVRYADVEKNGSLRLQ